MSKIDIVVPCYNYAHYLPYCMESILTQRDADLRVLIVDDCSPDNTPDVASRIAAQDSRVTYVRNEKNLGLIGTANRGILEWATAPYHLLISADDALTAGSLSRAIQVLDAHPEIGMVYGTAQLCDQDEFPPLDQPIDSLTYQIVPAHRFLARNFEWGNPVPSPTAVVRTEPVRRTGGYLAEFRHTSDMEMWMRLAAMGDIGAIRESQGFYRWHGNNMSTQFIAGPMRDAIQQIRTCDYAARTFTAPPGIDFREQMTAMRKRLATHAVWLAGQAFVQGDEENHQACIAFAKETYPPISRAPVMWRLRAKKLLGRGAAGESAKAKDAFRKIGETGGQYVRAAFEGDYGWWPAREGQA